MCKEYNGWENYPTWNVALWLDNDPYLYDVSLDIAQQDFEYEFERDEAYKELVQSFCSDGNETGIYADIMGWALANVNWRAISDSYKEQVAEC